MGRWLWFVVPGAVAALGFAVTVAGFTYDAAFAGIPYQDPTPGLEARWRFHSGVASAIELAGVAVTLVGVAALVCVGVWSLTGRNR